MVNLGLYGGNHVQHLSDESHLLIFAEEPYFYCKVVLNNGEAYHVGDLESATVVCINARQARLKVNIASQELFVGDSAQIERQAFSLFAVGGTCEFLVAGRRNQYFDEPSIKIIRAAEQYRVSKPWGHEIWFNGQHPGYAFKEVFIRAPHRTSLQYHQYKEETNVIYKGIAHLVYRANDAVANEDVKPEDLGTVAIESITAIHIQPPTLHRLVALTDVVIYEASTPHLDDVIRVSDDANRGHGKIETEHPH